MRQRYWNIPNFATMEIKGLKLNNPGMDFLAWNSSTETFPFQVQRDDLIHPVVSGNKSRKLQGWISYYFEENFTGIITFGGAFSNHLIATASVCNTLKIPCVGLVRGDMGTRNPYLDYCSEMGMELIFIARSEYREKSSLEERYQHYKERKNLLIPEGGKGILGFQGFEGLVSSWQGNFPDIIVHASATGTTAAGLARALRSAGAHTRILAVLVLRNLAEQEANLRDWGVFDEVELLSDYHFGGYAKMPESLIHFLGEAREQIEFPIEPVYTGKAFYALVNHILPENKDKKVCFLHTGGIMNY